MKIMIMAASSLPIPAYQGGATETLITQLLQNSQVKNKDDLYIDVFSHCEGANFKDGNISYYFFKMTHQEILYNKLFRIIRLILLRKININDNFPITLSKATNLSQYDLIILEGNKDQVLPLRKVYSGKIALHIHTVMTMTKETPFASRIVTGCDYIYANSQFALNKMLKINSKIDEKLALWKNCIVLKEFQTTDKVLNFRKVFRDEHNISDNEFLYIYCGRIEPGKGVLELIKAFKLLGEKGKLLIVGSSWFSSNRKTHYIRKCMKEIEEIKDRVIFSGYIPHKDISKYYHCSDVAIMPSIYEESAGLVALEAQACGIPVIISDIGGIPEFISPESQLKVALDSNFIPQIAHLMNRLYTDKQFYLQEKKLAQNNIKKYDMQIYVEDFLKLINTALIESK